MSSGCGQVCTAVSPPSPAPEYARLLFAATENPQFDEVKLGGLLSSDRRFGRFCLHNRGQKVQLSSEISVDIQQLPLNKLRESQGCHLLDIPASALYK